MSEPDQSPARRRRSNKPNANGEQAGGTRLTASEIYDNVRVAAEEELDRPALALFWSAVAAGLIIGFSFFAGAYLGTLVAPAYHTAAVAAGYPLGFIFVVLARNQLFTENTLEPVIPLLNDPSLAVLRRVMVLWGLVLLGNLLGALVFAVAAARTGIVSVEFQRALLGVATIATEGGFWLVAYKAVYAGWLIALMAWLLGSTRATGAQVVLIWLTTAPIAAFGFKHSIAGAVEAFYRAAAGGAGYSTMIFQFIVPAALGNVVGGVLLVALLNHGQVSPERERDEAAARRLAFRRRWRG
jgi:formate/nitrite transporter FocA (FNT family)